MMASSATPSWWTMLSHTALLGGEELSPLLQLIEYSGQLEIIALCVLGLERFGAATSNDGNIKMLVNLLV